jgi:hypothetical protein
MDMIIAVLSVDVVYFIGGTYIGCTDCMCGSVVEYYHALYTLKVVG